MHAAPAMKVTVIMPALPHTESLRQLTYEAVARIACSRAAATVMVCVNGLRGVGVESVSAELRRRCRYPLQVSYQPGRGIAAGWNEGCRHALGQAADFILLLANDAALFPETIDTLLEFGCEPDYQHYALWCARAVDYTLPVDERLVTGTYKGHWLVDDADYTCAMMRARTLATHGWFDENITPAYYEDADYQARINWTDELTAIVHAARMTHQCNATWRMDPDSAEFLRRRLTANRSYFQEKWGAESITSRRKCRESYFRHPSNDPSKPLHWWQPPGARLA